MPGRLYPKGSGKRCVPNLSGNAHQRGAPFRATAVWARLTQEKGVLNLQVTDNGKGITRKQAEDPRSFGIVGIRERVSLWNGCMRITGSKNKGTTVSIQIPICEEARA
ncbi:MAG: sensor histidine kinase [Desulfomonilia bacterium]